MLLQIDDFQHFETSKLDLAKIEQKYKVVILENGQSLNINSGGLINEKSTFSY